MVVVSTKIEESKMKLLQIQANAKKENSVAIYKADSSNHIYILTGTTILPAILFLFTVKTSG